MPKPMITYSEYLKAQKVVDDYKLQMSESLVKLSDLSINKKVKRNYPESWDYWVTELQGEDVLIRTTEDVNDPLYDDFLVNISEIRLV